MTFKVLVTGAYGQVGQEIVSTFKKNGWDVTACGRDTLDITNLEQVKDFLYSVKPDVVIHCAAYTAVDTAELEREKAFLVNAYGTRNISVISEQLNSKLVYISTDYIFNGQAKDPINEFELASPLGVYGKSKLAGEQCIRDFHSKFFIVRTSWVYGEYGDNFVKTMLKIAGNSEQIKVVNDQTGSPTYTVDLANCILNLVKTEKYGVYHVSNSGSCTWFEFAKAIFEEVGIKINLIPVSTQEFPRPAPRPSYSVLDHMALRLNGFPEIRGWREALKAFIKTLELGEK